MKYEDYFMKTKYRPIEVYFQDWYIYGILIFL